MFSLVKGIQKLEVLFLPIVNLISSIVHNMSYSRMQTIVIDTEPVLGGTCLNSYNVNLRKIHVVAMYPLAVKVY